MSTRSGLLESGLEALKQRRYSEAVQSLESFCREQAGSRSKEYFQAQMWLVKAYMQNDQAQKAVALCRHLMSPDNPPQIQSWARETLPSLENPQSSASAADRGATGQGDVGELLQGGQVLNRQQRREATPASQPAAETGAEESLFAKAGRAAQKGVSVPIAAIAGNLTLASVITLGLLFGMVMVLCLALFLILESNNPALGLALGLVVTLAVNAGFFFLAPLIMDLTQRWLYRTRWVSLSEVARYSPEAARTIQQVCNEKKLKQPRLGIIDDQNPTAFTYGSLPNSARLVVSQGLFSYLEDDEVATVYAHELGHIVHWDFAVMTLASTLIQITYLIYVFSRRMANSINNDNVRSSLRFATLTAYVFYIVGTYLVLYLSRTREYFADHFAAETTGNPNGLSRSLVKIAYGILEQSRKSEEPSRLVEGTRALGIYDPKAAASTGTAYSVAVKPKQIGQVMLWDLFNPWGWWMELNSTHPLTGKRIRALTTYAEKLGLDVEFDMANVIAEGRQLNKRKLYGTFFMDVLLYGAEAIAIVAGLAIAALLVMSLGSTAGATLIALPLFFFGVATLIKTFIMYPDFGRAPQSDVLTLMANPYASPLRGQPVKLEGEVLGRGNSGYRLGSDMQFRDRSGMIFLRYSSRFGPLGNLLFGAKQVEGLIGKEGRALGWFRRGIAPWVDLIRIDPKVGKRVTSYHRF